jgi:hypothetical protein
MEQGHRFNTVYFINKNIHEFLTNLKAIGKFPAKIWHCLLLNNARLHTSQNSDRDMNRHKFIRFPHPPCSPDLAPIDFSLFGILNGRLVKCHETTKKHFRNGPEILESISKEEGVILIGRLHATQPMWAWLRILC